MYRRRIKGYAAIGYNPKTQPVSQGLFAGLEESDTLSSFFDSQSFATIFRRDLAQARNSIVIACPNIHLHPNSPFYRLFAGLSARGIQIAIYTKDAAADYSSLTSIGVTLITASGLSCRCAVIDKRLIWYGSVNYLGKNFSDDNAMRVEDAALASELIDIVCNAGKN